MQGTTLSFYFAFHTTSTVVGGERKRGQDKLRMESQSKKSNYLVKRKADARNLEKKTQSAGNNLAGQVPSVQNETVLMFQNNYHFKVY